MTAILKCRLEEGVQSIVRIELHQGSALSPLLFVICEHSRAEVELQLEIWRCRPTLVSHGLSTGRGKTYHAQKKTKLSTFRKNNVGQLERRRRGNCTQLLKCACYGRQ